MSRLEVPSRVLQAIFEVIFVNKSLPLPQRIKKILVRALPYFILIIFIIGLPIFIAYFGISFFLLRFIFNENLSLGVVYLIALIFSVLSFTLMGLSIKWLFNKKRKGWE